MHVPATCTLAVLVCTFSAAHAAADQVEIVSRSAPENCSERATDGSVTVLHYVGYLSNGSEFESSRRRFDGPATHTLGSEGVVAGFDVGVDGMCVGENRTFRVPPALAYGDAGVAGKVPPSETVTFQVHLLELVYPASYHVMFQLIDVRPVDGQLSREELRAYFLHLLERRRRHRPGLLVEDVLGDQDETVDSLFRGDDADADGFISEAEFLAARMGPSEKRRIPTDEEIAELRKHPAPSTPVPHVEL